VEKKLYGGAGRGYGGRGRICLFIWVRTSSPISFDRAGSNAL